MPVEHGPGGTSITGPAVMGDRALVLKHGIALYPKTGIKPSRGVGVKQMCAIASEYTGAKYPSSRKGLEQALVDLTAALQPGDLDRVQPDGRQG